MQLLFAQVTAIIRFPFQGILNSYPKKMFSNTLRSFSLLLVFSIYIVNPSVVAADFLKVTSPAEINFDTPFEINLEISAQPNTNYFVKARLGDESGKLRYGQTLNETKNVWLSDTVNWQDFPQFSTDSNGVWVGKIHAKNSSSAKIGQNYLVIRIHSQNGTNSDSSAYTLTLAEEQLPPPAPPKSVVQDTGNPILNEFMPQPLTGSKEWVEIKNKGTGTADLSGWKIDDETGKSSPQILAVGTIIPAGGFLVVTFESSKLNDLTDSVRLLKPDDSVFENHTYSQTVRGQTWAKDSLGNWFLTDSISQNSENPNPPNSTTNPTDTTKNTSLTSVKTTSDPTEPTALGASVVGNKLPQVLGAKDKTIATVSASFSTKKSTSTVFFPLVILGSLLLLGAGIYFAKKKIKSGLSENSDQPL